MSRKEADRGGCKLLGAPIDLIVCGPIPRIVKRDGSQVCECRCLHSHGSEMAAVCALVSVCVRKGL